MIYDTSDPMIAQFKSDLLNLPIAQRDPAGPAERFWQDVGFRWREELSISKVVALGDAQKERAEKIRQVAGDEAYIKAITLPGDPATKQMIEALAADNDEIQTDEALMAGIRWKNKALRDERDLAMAHQTTGGAVAGFFGGALTSLADPLVLGTLPLGASWATGIAKTMLKEAGIAAATELAIQAPIVRYKQDLQSPYSLGEAALNVATAGVGAGLLTGAVKVGVNALARRVPGLDELLEAAERIPNKTTEQKDALALLRQQAEILRDAPVDGNIHLDAMAKATDDLTNGRPVKVDEFIGQSPVKPGVGMPVDDEIVEDFMSIANRQQVADMLAKEDLTIHVEQPGAKPNADGEVPTVKRSAREAIQEVDSDAKAASIIKGCMAGAGES